MDECIKINRDIHLYTAQQQGREKWRITAVLLRFAGRRNERLVHKIKRLSAASLRLYATRDCRIEMNDRVAQFRIMKHQPAIDFEECTRLNKESRGGFGSTGRK